MGVGKATYHNVNNSEQFYLRKTVNFLCLIPARELASELCFLSLPSKPGGDRTVNLVF
jgi:hypothetical protein